MFSISSLLEPKSWSSKEDAENVTKIARKFPNFIVWVLEDQENKVWVVGRKYGAGWQLWCRTSVEHLWWLLIGHTYPNFWQWFKNHTLNFPVSSKVNFFLARLWAFVTKKKRWLQFKKFLVRICIWQCILLQLNWQNFTKQQNKK